MQRSLINEFKGGSSSGLFQSTVLGTNSLLQRHKDGDLYKSRIAHLPNDTRIDLSRKLDFVVVFQSIQIERLGAQLQFLRGRMREREGAGLHQASYEVQIRELMERCSKLESEKYSYRQELSQTKAASESIFHQLSILQGRYSEVDFCAAEKYKLEKARGEELVVEIEKWKGRYAALERAKAEEHDSMRRVMEAQREAVGNRQAKDLLNRFELEKDELLGKLRDRKQQLDERQLQLKKLQNFYEQLQVRSRQDQAKVDSYEQKVAMLSQQTIRLSEMLRAKTEQIRSLKMMGEQDFSMKMSQINSLDETNHHLNDRVRLIEEQNDQLREDGRAMGEQLVHLKRKLVEVERLELQVREAKEDSENQLRAMERKDKRIFALQEDVKQGKIVEQEVKRLKAANVKMQVDLQQLQERLDAKIEELRRMKEQQSGLMRWREEFTGKLQSKMGEFSSTIQSLQRENSDIRSASEQNMERSAVFQLKAKEFVIQLKQKDYHINSLQNSLKQQEAKAKTKEVESTNALQKLETHVFAQRRNFEERLQQTQARRRDGQQYIRQAQSKCKQLQRRVKQADQRAKDSQSNQIRMRSLQAQCNQLESWGRSLENKNHQLQLHIAELDTHLIQMDEERAELRMALDNQAHFYHEVEQRYFQNGQEIKSIRSRLDNIEKILINLKTTVGLRLKSAQDQNRRLQSIESRYDQLYQWFVSASANFESGMRDSPTKQPQRSIFGTNDNSRYSTSLDRSSLSPLHRARSSQRTRENINSANSLTQPETSLPIQVALRHVLLCVEVESLRKRVGDKNAKVQSMRNSAIGIHPVPSGFFTSREPSGGKTIYY